VEEALIEMYLAGMSVRRVEDIIEALWARSFSSGTVLNLKKIDLRPDPGLAPSPRSKAREPKRQGGLKRLPWRISMSVVCATSS
jgi:hypothetical protein